MRAALEERARARGVELSIAWRVADDVLEGEYARAAIFAYGAHREPLGLAPLEAMARGIPVVAVAEGGVRETVEHARTGFLTERDPALFATRLAELLGSADLRRALGAAGRERARDWAWPDRVAALERELVALAAKAGDASGRPPLDAVVAR